MLKNLTAIIIACTTVIGLSAQDVGMEIELVYSDDGSIAGYPEGFSTWRVYAVLINDDDFLSAVYSVEGQQPLTITTSTQQVWNSGWGAVTTNDINPGIFVDHPEAQFDTWVTIGSEDANSMGDVFYVAQPSNATIENYFGTMGGNDEIEGDFVMNDGTWFNFNGDADGIAGEDHKVLIAQITTDGDLEMCASFQVFVNGDSMNSVFYDNLCANAMGTVSVLSQPIHLMSGVLSPNPVVDQAILTFNPNETSRIVVRDMMGRQIANFSQNLEGSLQFLAKDFSRGMYIIELHSRSGNAQTIKMIID